jgi:hypothetical protein
VRSRFLAYKRAALGHDGPRLPPGQVVARGWPILKRARRPRRRPADMAPRIAGPRNR